MYKNKEDFNNYMLKRYHQRRKEAITKLGGCCVICGSTAALEIDHIDPTKKSFNVAKIWNYSRTLFEAELLKCQLLCGKHHNEKTVAESGKQLIKGLDKHGTLSSYRYCKCALCRKAKADYMTKYKGQFV